MSFIELLNINKRYDNLKGGVPNQVLSDISLQIEEGEFISIIGPSGCGKSTLLHTIAGFITPTSGGIYKKGKEIAGPGPDRAVMFQELAIYPWKTVLENISLGLKASHIKKSQRHHIAQQYINLVQLNGYEDHYPAQLSGGMKQRVSIARCLITKPDVILMDEPFSALDALTRDIIQEEIMKIRELERKTFLLVTHSIDEAVFMSDRVYVMSHHPGKIKASIKIDLPRPRTLAMRSANPNFIAYRDKLTQSLRGKI